MSAFTDWNGPGTSGVASVPGVQTLQQLLNQLTVAEGHIWEVREELKNHEGSISFPGTLHPIISTYLQNKIDTTVSDLKGFINQEVDKTCDKAVTTAVAIAKSGNISTGDTGWLQPTTANAAAIQQLRTDVGPTGSITGITGLPIVPSSIIDGLNTLITSYNKYRIDMSNGIATNSLTVANAIAATSAIFNDTVKARKFIGGKLDVVSRIDFRNPAYVWGQAVPISNAPANTNNIVILLGVLSDVWDPTTSPPHAAPDTVLNVQNSYVYKDKPAQVYIKFVDDKPWNAIVEMAATKPNDQIGAVGSQAHTASLKVTCAKTPDRGPLTFGIYEGRTSAGVPKLYLGIITEDTLQRAGAIGNYLSPTYISGQDYWVGGINFLPLDRDNRINHTNSAVNELTRVTVNSPGVADEFDKIAVNTIYSNDYRDTVGHGVAVTDETEDTLKIGDDPNDPSQDGIPRHTHAMELYTSVRPVIYQVTNTDPATVTKHQMAFLEDLVQGILWQQDVDIVVDTLADLSDWHKTSIYQNTTTSAYVSRQTGADSAGAALSGFNKIPGVYLVDPASASTISAIPFAAGDVALVKADTTSVQLPNGLYNGVFSSTSTGTTIPNLVAANVNGINGKFAVGITLIDTAGTLVKVTSYTAGNAAFEGQVISNTDAALTAYFKPYYITFNGTTWDTSTIAYIDIPTTPTGYIDNRTYEWGGKAAELSRVAADWYYYEQAYIMWSPAHTNQIEYDTFKGYPWSNVVTDMAGYRAAERQDEIDLDLLAIARSQSDFASREPLAQIDLPEHTLGIGPNPTYIHNRPWIGTSIFDGGAFDAQPSYYHWYVDGGDFTGLAGALTPGAIPAATQQEKFRNMIMRLWHGDYDKMPELSASTDKALPSPNANTAIWTNFTRTLRWVDSVDVTTSPQKFANTLWYSTAGNPLVAGDMPKLWHFIPAETLSQTTVLQDLFVTDQVVPAAELTFIEKFVNLAGDEEPARYTLIESTPSATYNNQPIIEFTTTASVDPTNPATPYKINLNLEEPFVQALDTKIVENIWIDPVAWPASTVPVHVQYKQLVSGVQEGPYVINITNTDNMLSFANTYTPLTMSYELRIDMSNAWRTLMDDKADKLVGATAGAILVANATGDYVESTVFTTDTALDTVITAKADKPLAPIAGGRLLIDNGTGDLVETLLEPSDITDKALKINPATAGGVLLESTATGDYAEITQTTVTPAALAAALTALATAQSDITTLQSQITALQNAQSNMAGLDVTGEPIPAPPATGGPYQLAYNPAAAVGSKFGWQ